MLSKSASAEPPKEIFVIKPSSLGDVVHTLPAVALIKKHWPETRLRWLVNPEWAPLLEGNPFVDEVVIFPRKELRGARGLWRIAPWARGLRRLVRADLILDFQGLLRSALIARLCRAKGGVILGLSDAREGSRFLYDGAANVGGIDHAVDRYLALVASFGVKINGALDWPLPEGTAPEGFDASTPFVILHPFSRGAGKSLALDDIGDFFDKLAPHRIVLAGRHGEDSICPANVVNLLNRTTLPELVWLLRRAAFVVSVDSGPMHIAAALTPRLLSIHTWSDPRKVGPYQPEAWVWKDGALFRMRDIASPKDHLPAPGIEEVAAFTRARLT